jgi:hypothetical protein
MATLRQIDVINKAFVEGLKKILNNILFGVYIYGTAVFPDKLPTGDIDFHVILKTGLIKKERLQLEKFHKFLEFAKRCIHVHKKSNVKELNYVNVR